MESHFPFTVILTQGRATRGTVPDLRCRLEEGSPGFPFLLNGTWQQQSLSFSSHLEMILMELDFQDSRKAAG